ncbi:MAG: strawberry notch C-terminal domain-containing protein, partial [Monoglobaceae bacterium]
MEEKIGSKKDADVDAFQNGNKRIIIFSKAGGTGKSYHADRAAKNQQQRVHYLLEAGWQADNAVQGFGRSHRSNQAVAPIFKLVTTDLKGQMRFISTIAKRLDQLGAMTKGQRQAGGQGMFSASDNLENSFAADVLAVFYKDLAANRVDGIDDGLEIIEKLGLKDKILNEYNQIIPTASELREVNKFLNRILSLESSEQNIVFDGYSQRLQDATEKAMLAGTLDKGLENYKADRITLNEVKDIREDERSGAKTKYYSLTAEHKIKPVKFEDLQTESKSFVGFFKNRNTGNVRAVMRTSSTTDQYGNVTDNFKLVGQVKNEYIPQNRFYSNWVEVKPEEAEKLWNEELSKLPEYRKENLHLISGVVLPVWDKLPTENVRIYRVLTSDGEMLIGRVVSENIIDETLRRLGSSRTKEKIATKDLVTGIKNGNTVHLENNWKIVQRKVSGENRIELVGPSYEHYEMLMKKGVFAERIQYNTRYFVPADTNTEKIIDKILKISPVMRVENAKYSITERGASLNGQKGNYGLPENAGRNGDARSAVKSKPMFRIGKGALGKRGRQKYVEKLDREYDTEREVINKTVKAEFIKEHAYNDDMREIETDLKALGFKKVGFFLGSGRLAYSPLSSCSAVIFEDSKEVYLRYDDEDYSPRQLAVHEYGHEKYNSKLGRKIKHIIENSIPLAERNAIMQQKRY